MKKIFALLILLHASSFAHGIERNCTVSQDATAYYDSGNYHNMLYLQSSSLSAWSARMATDVLQYRAKLIPAGTTVDVIERLGDSLAIRVGGNTYYVMPDYVDCP